MSELITPYTTRKIAAKLRQLNDRSEVQRCFELRAVHDHLEMCLLEMPREPDYAQRRALAKRLEDGSASPDDLKEAATILKTTPRTMRNIHAGMQAAVKIIDDILPEMLFPALYLDEQRAKIDPYQIRWRRAYKPRLPREKKPQPPKIDKPPAKRGRPLGAKNIPKPPPEKVPFISMSKLTRATGKAQSAEVNALMAEAATLQAELSARNLILRSKMTHAERRDRKAILKLIRELHHAAYTLALKDIKE